MKILMTPFPPSFSTHVWPWVYLFSRTLQLFFEFPVEVFLTNTDAIELKYYGYQMNYFSSILFIHINIYWIKDKRICTFMLCKGLLSLFQIFLFQRNCKWLLKCRILYSVPFTWAWKDSVFLFFVLGVGDVVVVDDKGAHFED